MTEFEVLGQLAGAANPYKFSNLQVLRVRDGQIVVLRDYWSPLQRPELRAIAQAGLDKLQS